jgi:hypothetical protein
MLIRPEQEFVYASAIFEERLPTLCVEIEDHLVAIQVLTREEAIEHRPLIQSLLRSGYGYGFRRFDSLAQFVSYWFLLGPGWDTPQPIAAILRDRISEEDKWARIDVLLPEE